MNTFNQVCILLIVLAIVIAGVKTETKSVTAKPASKTIKPTVIKLGKTKKPKTRRLLKRSLTDPKSKFASAVGRRMDIAGEGKWTVVHFWATWCSSCKEATPDLVQLNKKYSSKGVEFVGVNLDTEPSAMTDYISMSGIRWSQIPTKAGWQSPIRLQYRVPSIPAVYLVGPNGKVVEAGMKGFEDADRRLQHHLSNSKAASNAQ